MARLITNPLFPPVSRARKDGLLLVGGYLNPTWLLAAYRRGIFPWPVCDEYSEILAWFSPDPRAVLELDGLHTSRRLRRRIRSGQYTTSSDRDFAGVIRGCAAPRRDDHLTWITPELAAVYLELHRMGYAHSVETWQNGRLVGGVYGLALGGYFSGESLFHTARDASKVALVHLVRHLRQRGFELLDIQQSSPLLTRMGATEIPRRQFLERLDAALNLPVRFADTR
jgi:leucyl/phenylalanyl-tRNA--protein transferase